jgi:hypothetical protein
VSRPHGQGRSRVVDGRGDGFSLSTHKHPERAGVADQKPADHHVLHAEGSWLNMVGICFGIITCQAIRRGTFRSVKDLIAAIETFIDRWKDRCEPFVWTKTADDIISKARPRQTLQTRNTRRLRGRRGTQTGAYVPGDQDGQVAVDLGWG